jgi:hypothetical protein
MLCADSAVVYIYIYIYNWTWCFTSLIHLLHQTAAEEHDGCRDFSLSRARICSISMAISRTDKVQILMISLGRSQPCSNYAKHFFTATCVVTYLHIYNGLLLTIGFVTIGLLFFLELFCLYQLLFFCFCICKVNMNLFERFCTARQSWNIVGEKLQNGASLHVPT